MTKAELVESIARQANVLKKIAEKVVIVLTECMAKESKKKDKSMIERPMFGAVLLEAKKGVIKK